MPQVLTCVTIAGMKLSNPLIAASGTCGYGYEMQELVDVEQYGAVVTKTITKEPREGNEQPRLLETPSGLLNSIGLQNIGLDAFVADVVPQWKAFRNVKLIVSVGGNTIEDYCDVCSALDAVQRIDAFEINISCPNVKQGCLAIGTDIHAVQTLVEKLKHSTKKPLIVKLSPNVNNITAFAACCEHAGADAVSLVNTFLGMAIDIETRTLYFKNGVAGLSGPAIKPMALKLVHDVAHAVHIPVIGIGGIATSHDALEFLIAGAAAIEIGTAHFVNPRIVCEIREGIEEYCVKHQVRDVQQLKIRH